MKTLKDQNEEIIYANVWRDTIKGLDWAESIPSISPGRFAVGYNYLYVITRILMDMKPMKVLDVGLGISSTVISSYFKHNQGEHLVLEHDKEWADFYNRSHELSVSSTIVFQNITKDSVGNEEYNRYSKEVLDKTLAGQKFSVISIDAPNSNSKARYARRDLIDYIPDILEESFVIVIDDANRKGEQNTIKDIEKNLRKNDINFYEKIYKGNTYVCVIASQDNMHFCSL